MPERLAAALWRELMAGHWQVGDGNSWMNRPLAISKMVQLLMEIDMEHHQRDSKPMVMGVENEGTGEDPHTLRGITASLHRAAMADRDCLFSRSMHSRWCGWDEQEWLQGQEQVRHPAQTSSAHNPFSKPPHLKGPHYICKSG